jgi:hypothetical protein
VKIDPIQKFHGYLTVPKELRQFVEGQVGGCDKKGSLVLLWHEGRTTSNAIPSAGKVALMLQSFAEL